jgi:hypothetical protein
MKPNWYIWQSLLYGLFVSIINSFTVHPVRGIITNLLLEFRLHIYEKLRRSAGRKKIHHALQIIIYASRHQTLHPGIASVVFILFHE